MKPKRILVLGATGATGRRLVIQLLAWGNEVRAVVRDSDRLPPDLRGYSRLTLVEGNVLDLDREALAGILEGCDAVVSCLGHNLSLRGLFGPPWRLVTRSVARICEVIRSTRPETPVRFVLMCSAGVRDADADEPVSPSQRVALALLRGLVPPHADNEQAAAYFSTRVGRDDPFIEWSVVRPDSLQEGVGVSGYAVYPSPTRSALFDPGRARRSNVAHFMACLACRQAEWRKWRHRMPVLYNEA